MTGPRFDFTLLDKALATPRWNILARTGLDVATIGTWDEHLQRRKRICVPMDIQALLVPAAGGEAFVTVRGDSRDAAPFAAGAPRAAGVHLHWALPDALLRGEPTARDATGQSDALAMPALPDRWVVLRQLRPRGGTRVIVRGWVVDASTRTTVPLEAFSGTFPPRPSPDPDLLSPLDGAIGGSLIWTASYAASEGRFTFHDPLTDVPPSAGLAPNGLHDASATYVIAGWWSDMTQDPLGSSVGLPAMNARRKELKWALDDDALPPVTRDDRARRDRTNASIGLVMPVERPVVEFIPDVGSSLGKKLFGVTTGIRTPVTEALQTIVATPQPEFASMLHGAVFGVPLAGGAATADDRPTATDVSIALGQDVDDIVAAFGAGVLGAAELNRAAAERLTAAFTSDLLDRIATADGISDLAEHEHSDGFDSLPGTPLPGARPDRFIASDGASANPLSIGRKGRGASAARSAADGIGTKMDWLENIDMFDKAGRKGGKQKRRTGARAGDDGSGTPVPSVREVVRPAPRNFFPQPPVFALRGAKPNLRHHGDGRFEDGDMLRCRYAEECVSELTGVVRGADVLPTLGSGAIPEEVLVIAREAVLLDPFGTSWLHATATTGLPDAFGKAVKTRLTGEVVRLFGTSGSYDGSSHIVGVRPSARTDPWLRMGLESVRIDRELTAQLAAHSIMKGTPPSPVAITTWRQPWVPLWTEWRVVLEGTATLDGWRLDGLDLEPDGTAIASTISRTITGRAPLSTGVAEAMHAGIKRWLQAEEQRDKAGTGVLNADDQEALKRLGNFLEPIDLASASLDGVREQMLGIAYMGQMPLDAPTDGTEPRPIASALPVPFFGGRLRLDAMRLVDAFGRTLDLDVSRVSTTRSLEVAADPSSILLRPRVQHAARWVVRFVGAPDPTAVDPSLRPDAFVDQVAPDAMVNPVAGFLLPDHIDESLEVFATDGTPIGELGHDAITGAVTWEPAPGRPVPPDAGPFAALSESQAPIAEIAAGVLLADVAARAQAVPPDSTSLSSMLRAIDTTLWTVDTYAAIGSPSIAGLVGRPVAVVRAMVRLETPDDTAVVTPTHVGGAAARREIFAALRDMRFPFRLGALERSDDALLGFYLGDDFQHLHLVDKVVLSQAPDSGRLRGALGQLGAEIDVRSVPIVHPYIVAEDELWIRPGQEIALTLLLLPAGKVHLTSGILPRKALTLAENWVGPGLKVISPSVRIGPVLVDPSEIRLPLIRAMGPRQRFTRRTGPLTWRDDPITASTMSAYLPRMPHEAQEGWIRVQPDENADGGTP